MIELAFAILGVAGVIGIALVLLYLRSPGSAPPHPVFPAAHGAIGAASLALLLVALRGAGRHSVMGTAGFGRIAAWLLGLALLLGLAIAAGSWRRKRPSGALVGTHAALAIAALVMLWALLALG